jgi:hypothetical protein
MTANRYILISSFVKPLSEQEWRDGKSREIPSISVGDLKKKINSFTSDLSEALEDIDKSISRYELDEITIQVAIEATGELSLVGVGGAGVTASSGITFVFRKKKTVTSSVKRTKNK